MERKSLFERMERELDISYELKKIELLLHEENTFYDSIESVFSQHFRRWKHRGNYLSLDELRDALGLNHYTRPSSPYTDRYEINENEFFQYCELITNLIVTFRKYMCNEQKVTADAIKKTIELDLDKVNYCIQQMDGNRFIVVEKDKAATAVAEIISQKLSCKVIEYNHYLLRGNIDKKRSILLALADELEPKRSMLKSKNEKLENQLFFLFNNVNIRHNNSESGKYYQPAIASMNRNEIEEIYDKTYQMSLLAILLLDNIKRSKQIDALISKNDSLKSIDKKVQGDEND